jgi:peptidoglycan/LPS O-acetylase OafA/YrhL
MALLSLRKSQEKLNTSLRFDALTGVRFIAATMVFVYHNRKYWRNNLHPEFLRLINEFNIGLSLFFVLSGFLISYTYGEKPMESFISYYKYALLRIARILPLYWLILSCFYIDKPYGNRLFSWQTYTLVHAFSSKHNLDGIVQAWSLNVEMVFYFFAPLLILIKRKHIILLIVFLACLFFATWGIGAYWQHLNGNPQKYFYPVTFILDSTFPGRATEFLAGVLMAASFKNTNGSFFRKIPHKTFIGFSGILLTAYCIGLFEPTVYDQGTDVPFGRAIELLILPVFVVIALAGLIQENTKFKQLLSSRFIVLLGNASFAFYLIHISYVSLKLRDYVLLPDRNFVLLWIISITLYLLFEKPVYEFFRKRLKKSL